MYARKMFAMPPGRGGDNGEGEYEKVGDKFATAPCREWRSCWARAPFQVIRFRRAVRVIREGRRAHKGRRKTVRTVRARPLTLRVASA